MLYILKDFRINIEQLEKGVLAENFLKKKEGEGGKYIYYILLALDGEKKSWEA